MQNRHDLPCFICDGTNSCSLFMTPEPHLHCFKCRAQKHNLTEEDLLDLNTSNLIQINAPLKEVAFERGVVNALADRAITKETAEKFRVETLYNTNNEPYARAFNHFNAAGEIVAQKIKYFDGKTRSVGNHAEITMFGSNLFSSGGKYITITEGEEDALAAYQMLKAASPGFEPCVVSIPDGASSAEKSCKKAWEYINSFENIIIAFDGDDVGQKAAEKISKLFLFKPKVILFSSAKKNQQGKWELKDANDYLKANLAKEFVNLWWRADKLQPKGVLSFNSLWDSMVKKDVNTVVPYPWAGLNSYLPGLVTGHFVVVKAPPKVGKTALLKEIAYHIHSTSEHNVGLIFLENTKKEIGLGLCALHMNTPLSPWEIPSDLSELQKAHAHISKDDRITIFDPEDERTVENIFNKILYFVKAHNCRYILLDHITMLSYQAENTNERMFLDKLCADLKGLTTALDICIIAVTHVNDDGKTRGSRASVQLCESLISLERDKTNSDPIVANTTIITVEENRWGGCGIAAKLYYDKDTGRMTELTDDLDLTSPTFDV
jgi:twinkle protein